MMTPAEFQEHLTFLKVDPSEAPRLLGVSDRTMRRWADEASVPPLAERTVRAWSKLEELHIPWRPDSISVFENDEDQISRMREFAVEVADMIQRVEARGGPKAPWSVDLAKGVASLGPVSVNFYTLANGSFSPSSYSRRDIPPDRVRDAELIEDAAFCIYRAFEGSTAKAEALNAVAKYVRSNAHVYVRDGARMHTESQRKAHILLILTVAGEIEELASLAVSNRATYRDFQMKLARLQQLGFFPEVSLVSEVARLFR